LWFSLESATASQSSFTIDCNQVKYANEHSGVFECWAHCLCCDARLLGCFDHIPESELFTSLMSLEKVSIKLCNRSGVSAASKPKMRAAGTAELDGAALLVRIVCHRLPLCDLLVTGRVCFDNSQSAVINHLATTKSNGTGRPRVVVTTHFLVNGCLPVRCKKLSPSNRTYAEQEIFRHKLLSPAIMQTSEADRDPDVDISPVVFMVMTSTGESTTAAETPGTATPVVVPLYELCRGVSAHSNAFGCAAKCGTFVNKMRLSLECHPDKPAK
jgi:hypothetical protein